jgi:hypothetical protein
MCDPKIIEKIDNGQAIVFTKARLYIWIITLIVAFTVTITTVKLQAQNNTERICKIEEELKPMKEIQFNLKKLCEHFEIQYTEIKE